MTASQYVLGISSHFHDAAAVLVCGHQIVAAAQEERFSRKKADPEFPQQAIAYCLSRLPNADTPISVAYYENPALKLDRVLGTASRTAPRGAPLWPRTLNLMHNYGHVLPVQLQTICNDPERIFFVPHHRSHAASAFYPSPFGEAAVLVVDGVGEWSTTSLWSGTGNQLTPFGEIRFPNSLGMFYSAFTQYCGFKVNSGEYKLMGLAPFGQPRFRQLILDNLIDLKPDGSFQLDMSFFRFDTDASTISPLFETLFHRPARLPEESLDQHYMDVAASAQVVLQEVLVRLARMTLQKSGQKNLCLAGGVALNCVANSYLIDHVPGLENLWIQPAAGDAGGALGAALDVVAHLESDVAQLANRRPSTDHMTGSFLGPEYDDKTIENALERAGLVREKPDDLPQQLATALADGQIVGHFDSRMEFGPRALGNRSILADPRPSHTLQRVNLRIKFREGWRPFAPMVLKNHVARLFDGPAESPYMLLVASLKPEFRHQATLTTARAAGNNEPLELMEKVSSDFSAVTHVDFSARLQTVDPTAPLSRATQVLQAFHKLTGCPMLLNTSFNVRGEPIVCSPDDAIRCFLNTHMDLLAIGPFLVYRSAQPSWVDQKIGKRKFDAD